MKKITIALLGQPNSGKSTLFNGLTGSNQHVGNWPGKTVEKKKANFRIKIPIIRLWIYQELTDYQQIQRKKL